MTTASRIAMTVGEAATDYYYSEDLQAFEERTDEAVAVQYLWDRGLPFLSAHHSLQSTMFAS